MQIEILSNIIFRIFALVCAFDFTMYTFLFTVYMVNCMTKIKNKLIGGVLLSFFIIYKSMHYPVFLNSVIDDSELYIYILDIIIYILTSLNLVISFFQITVSSWCIIKKLYVSIDDINKYDYKFVNIIVPIYNEEFAALEKTITSICNLNYKKENINVFLTFDDISKSELYNKVLMYLSQQVIIKEDNDLDEIYYKNIQFYVIRNEHGGKKSAQKGAYEKIKHTENSLVFFIDSDTEINTNCLLYFVREMSITNKVALTGLITCRNNNIGNVYTYLQDAEYIFGQALWRSVENFFGAVTCLPGAFTILDYKSFHAVSEKYFVKHSYKDIFDYQRLYLGEDRYLTQIMIEEFPNKVGFCDLATCKTIAPKTLSSFVKQRRRWFLGQLSNDVFTMMSPKCWKYYTIFSILNYISSIRYTNIFIYLYLYISFSQLQLLIIIPMVAQYLLMILYCIIIKKIKVILYYPFTVLLQPIANILIMYYSIYTFYKQSWGGARVSTPII